MPKIDTLDAFSGEMTTTLTTILTANLENRSWQPILTTSFDYQPFDHRPDLIGPRCALDMPKICQRHAQGMPESCLRYA